MSRDLLRHVLDTCEDPDCEIHQIEVGLEEHTVTTADLAFFIAGAQAAEIGIRRAFYRGLEPEDPMRKKLLDACRVAGEVLIRQAYIHAFACSDCGAPAGRPCYAEYGCELKSRTIVV